MKKWLTGLAFLAVMMVGMSSLSHSQEITLLSAVDGLGNFRKSLACAAGFTCNITNINSIVANANIQSANLFATATGLTDPGPTGVTYTNANNALRGYVVGQATIASTAFVCAALTCDVTVFTLPAKTFVQYAIADLTVVYACASVCTSATLTMQFGKGAGGTEYLASFNANTATGQFGKTQATLGTALAALSTTVPNVGVFGDLASWTATQSVVLRLTSATGNIGTGAATNLSGGSVTIDLVAAVLP